MDFVLSQKQLRLREQFRRLAESLEPAGREYPRANLQRLAREGCLGLPVPREWGGRGEDFVSYILLLEEVSRVCASTGVILAVHTSVGTFPLLYYGSPEQKERYLSGLARGEKIGAFALTEAQAGSDAGALRTTATPVEGGYRLNGAKLFITSGGEADLYTVFATVAPEMGKKGITAFLVEKGTPGLFPGPPEKKMGLHGSATTELLFDDLYLPHSQRLGAEGEGFAIAMSLLDGGRIGIAAQALGIAGAAVEATLRCLDLSRAGQGARFVMADLAARLEAARLLVYRAAWRKELGKPCSREAAMAKTFATDLAMEATTSCLDLWGLEGTVESCPVQRYFCDAKVTQIYEGTNQIQRLVIARELLRAH
ncbi:MAG: acyl-CoA dehydrogenase family protein [Dethiobacteria bacterium]|jgi:alkylation response protein AidB-like acyl-CoA dehydrogenase|nr:acyl-CoA dehydrogenase [Bacillota bacterium]HOP68409.1 acyl-CoA dehydrogenase family protein [Bacillota bacterium]HPT33515.1 acyl-CoA dehydrogenase family protein [Bacillota bacterium]HQD06785.1 acyl-CoA dehydrogenase family protein [Bacillota bacterium]